MNPVPLLVTGAPGWLCDVLLPTLSGYAPLTCLVHDTLPEATVAQWHAAQPTVTRVLRGDIGKEASLREACKGLAGGTVLHAAAVIHPHRVSDWLRINRDASVQLARLARDAGARRFVFVSSNAAQGAGKNAEDILTEEQPCRPLSLYGRSKAEAEEQLLKMHAPGQFEVVVLRPCMFYGPPVPQRHIDVFNRIRAGRLPLVGSGQYARSLTYIDDLVAGTRTALTHPAAAGEVFYCCDTQVYTTRSVCEAMAAALGVPARFIPIPSFSSSLAYGADRALTALGLYSMNVHLLGEANWHVGCSNAKARRLLGYGSSIEVFEGYRRAIAWCRKQGRLS